tara:strand:- start:546 stop:1109 length:564 start_codon:yes stop_codon:yes gene_type:complete
LVVSNSAVLNKWIEVIDQTTLKFQDAFGKLNAEELNWKPAPEKWSIAQNIDHLIVINKSYFPVIESLQKGTYKTPFLGKLGFLVSFFGKTVLNSVNPDRRRKMRTFEIWEPAKSEISANILNRFVDHQSDLKNMIKHSRNLLINGAVISSPANKNIVYTLEKAFDIIVLHEQRHFEQSKEVYHLMKL